MWRFYAAVVVVWLVLMPPFFTRGACTAEFEAEAARLQADGARLFTTASALRYWGVRSQPVALLSAAECRQAKPRFLDRCGKGPLMIVKVPVQHLVCRVYRDSEIRVQLQYDEREQLARVAFDMAPYKSLPIPMTGIVLHWAR